MEVILLAGEEIPVPVEWEAEWTKSRYERLARQKSFLPVTGNQTLTAYYVREELQMHISNKRLVYIYMKTL